LYCCVYATVQLADGSRLVPGILVQVNHGPLKQCDPESDYDCFHGPPNFVLDVFPSDDLLDYEQRRECFERAGVFEYVAVQLKDSLLWTWNRLVQGKFTVIESSANELIMSAALPGLWIPPQSLQHRDWWAVMGSIARGVSRRGHHEFMETIWNKSTEEENRQVLDDYRSGRMGTRA
jgi:hypothetical protein